MSPIRNVLRKPLAEWCSGALDRKLPTRSPVDLQ